MFSIRIPHQDQTATIKLSSARTHSEMEGRTKGLAFKYVREGCEYYKLGDQTIALREGEFMLLPADRPFKAMASPKKKVVSGVCIDFLRTDFALFEGAAADSFVFGVPLPFRELQGTHEASLNNIRAFAQNEESLVLECLRSDLHQLLPEMYRKELILKSLVKKQRTQQRLVQGLLAARNYIQDHYTERITLEDLAKVASISSYRLQRLFVAVFDQSPQRMQCEYRMVQAKKLLADQRYSLSEIAFHLGYSDLSAFSNQFQQYYHCRPSQMQ